MIKLINLPSLFLLTNLVLGTQPNIVLVMTDDQGWGQTGYMNHPVLKTPQLDNMASNSKACSSILIQREPGFSKWCKMHFS